MALLLIISLIAHLREDQTTWQYYHGIKAVLFTCILYSELLVWFFWSHILYICLIVSVFCVCLSITRVEGKENKYDYFGLRWSIKFLGWVIDHENDCSCFKWHETIQSTENTSCANHNNLFPVVVHHLIVCHSPCWLSNEFKLRSETIRRL
jgi:hypothetical protein